MFGTMAGGENPGPGGSENNWAQCLTSQFQFFSSNGAGVHGKLSVAVWRRYTLLWPKAATKSGKAGHRGGVVKAAVCFMARWYRKTRRREADCATQLRTPRAATRGRGGGGRAFIYIADRVSIPTARRFPSNVAKNHALALYANQFSCD